MNASDIEKIIHLYDEERKAAESCKEYARSAERQLIFDEARRHWQGAANHNNRAGAIAQVLNILGYSVMDSQTTDGKSYKIVKE